MKKKNKGAGAGAGTSAAVRAFFDLGFYASWAPDSASRTQTQLTAHHPLWPSCDWSVSCRRKMRPLSRPGVSPEGLDHRLARPSRLQLPTVPSSRLPLASTHAGSGAKASLFVCAKLVAQVWHLASLARVGQIAGSTMPGSCCSARIGQAEHHNMSSLSPSLVFFARRSVSISPSMSEEHHTTPLLCRCRECRRICRRTYQPSRPCSRPCCSGARGCRR